MPHAFLAFAAVLAITPGLDTMLMVCTTAVSGHSESPRR
jgi:threonine/homoserine/homoserine lactone efflux protein